MLRDVFYFGDKPNVHPREKSAKDLADARNQCTTEHFWIINEFCDYRGFDWDFDFEFLPDEDVWAEFHNNVWPSQHQKDSGTWLCPKEHSDLIVYRCDVDIVKRKNIKTDSWVLLDNVDETKFDFSWHPDPTDPPYIYKWGCKFYPAEIQHVLEYHVAGATDIKYMKSTVELLPNDYWVEHYPVDREHFDFTWRPDPMDPPFIYVWGNKHVDGNVAPTLEYHVPGATERKHLPELIQLLPQPSKFEHLENCDGIDYSWIPDPTSPPYIYVWGNQWNKPEDKISIQYVVEGATEYKYMEERAIRKPCMDNWLVPDNVDVSNFDFSWEPSPKEPAFIYQFGTQHQKTGGPRYIVSDATNIKYIDATRARALPSKENWVLPDKIQIQEFDYSWHPDATEQPYTYQFGTQWQLTGGPKYVSPNSIGIKYIDPSVLHAKASVDMSCWDIPEDIDRNTFDFSWHPHPEDPDYIYEFGTQWHDRGGPRYVPNIPDNEMLPIKYIDTRILKATRLATSKYWEIPDNIDKNSFDFSWCPHPDDLAFVYQFGTQHQKTGGPRYVIPGARSTKYIDIQKARVLPSRKNWEIPEGLDVSKFDFSWHPDVTEPKSIYQFGTLLDDVHLKDGPRYVDPDNTGTIVYLENKFVNSEIKYPKYTITTTLEDLINLHPNEIFWAVRDNIDYSNFDFDWVPTKEQAFNINVFGSSESETTQTYFVNAKFYHQGYTDKTFINNTKIDDEFLSTLFVKPNMFLVDRGNVEAQKRFEELKARFPDIQKTRFLNTWVDTISRCVNRSSTELCWILNSELDYAEFNFDYYPNPWQMKMVHVFGTQWSHWGTTYIVNRETFANDTKYINIIEHLSNLNFVKDQNKRARATSNLYDIFVVDHGNKEMFKTFRTIQSKANGKSVNSIDYKGNYLDTFKEILKQVSDKKENYIWICSSICDYTKFDFTYICDPFAREQLHVFPSTTQKYGDTFLVNVNKLRELITGMNTLQDYDKINFNRHMVLNRYPAPEIISDDDTHTSSLDIRFDYPYVVLTTEDNKEIEKIDYEPINLWSKETKNIVIASSGATRVVVPKEVKDVVKREFYDYPYIVKNSRLAKSKPLDIVFLSNGEPGADENYEHLLNVTRGLTNRIVRVDNVNGRVAAYHAAAEASETPWMFTVFAKLKVSNRFDWNWQPDRLQVPKHYVFHAKNPVNGLVYGHQAMIAYNKKITLANTGRGLDFTQDDVHEVVDIVSGVANFNTDEWTTWRTSFREAIKLCTFSDEISQERLKTWTTVANGNYAQYCLDGANDAVQYFDEVAGDFDLLKLSYDWAWLKLRFDSKYGK